MYCVLFDVFHSSAIVLIILLLFVNFMNGYIITSFFTTCYQLSIHCIFKVYARDVTLVSPIALALFGGRLKIFDRHCVVAVEGGCFPFVFMFCLPLQVLPSFLSFCSTLSLFSYFFLSLLFLFLSYLLLFIVFFIPFCSASLHSSPPPTSSDINCDNYFSI